MNDQHEVISAFIDDEPFDPQALADALADPAGRALLIDLIALRHVVQPTEAALRTPASPRRRNVLVAGAAAAGLVLALFGGYLVGQSRTVVASSDAPAATRIVQGPSEWQAPLPRGAQ